MIYIKLTGGLGNQMFQYAAARWVQEITKQKLCLDYSDLLDYENNHNATFENTLMKLNSRFDLVIKNKEEFLQQTGKFGEEYYKKYRYLSWVSRIGLFEKRIFVERKNQNEWNKRGFFFARDGYIPIFPENNKSENIVMSGFFQSVKYFPGMKDFLLQELCSLMPISENNQKWIERFVDTNSVCLHIRRGDFTKKGRQHCTINYYIKAIREMQKIIADPVFFVFSDDIGWVEKNLIVDNVELIYVNEENDSVSELGIMKNCKHFIISNSTFSWWAQYLAVNESKVVIAPRPWMRRIPTDIYLEDWITMPVYE